MRWLLERHYYKTLEKVQKKISYEVFKYNQIQNKLKLYEFINSCFSKVVKNKEILEKAEEEGHLLLAISEILENENISSQRDSYYYKDENISFKILMEDDGDGYPSNLKIHMNYINDCIFVDEYFNIFVVFYYMVWDENNEEVVFDYKIVDLTKKLPIDFIPSENNYKKIIYYSGYYNKEFLSESGETYLSFLIRETEEDEFPEINERIKLIVDIEEIFKDFKIH